MANKHGWISIMLRWYTIAGFILLATAMLIGIAALTALSRTNSGFVAIESDAVSLLGREWSMNLLWTSLPAFIFRLAASFWNMIIVAFLDRQPHVELGNTRKKGPVHIKRSIMLDYRTVMVPMIPIEALKNRHFLAASTTLLGLIFSLFVTSLASSMIVPSQHLRRIATSITQITEYDARAMNSTMNWKPVYDKVSTILIGNGQPSAWTNDEFAFPAFATVENAPLSSVVTSTNGSSAYLDCAEITDYHSFVRSVTAGIMSRIVVEGSDRGCDFSYEFGVANTTSTYLETSSVRTCSLAALQSRMLFVAGQYDANATPIPLSQVGVISCIAGYGTTAGHLTFSTTSNVSGLDFKRSADTYFKRHLNADVIESNMVLSTDFSLNAGWTTSHFGSIVLYLTSARDKSSFLAPNILIAGIRDTFRTSYLTAVAMNSFLARADTTPIAATLLEPQTRLFVVEWIAALCVTTLVLCLVLISIVWWSVRSNSTSLQEEPQGLVSAAGLLHGSDLLTGLVQEHCQLRTDSFPLVEHISNRSDFKDIKCTMETFSRDSGGHSHEVITITRADL